VQLWRDAEGIREQLQGIRKTVSLLYDNVGAIESVVSPREVGAKPAEVGLYVLTKIHAKVTIITVVNGYSFRVLVL